jgi:hypothetical protein
MNLFNGTPDPIHRGRFRTFAACVGVFLACATGPHRLHALVESDNEKLEYPTEDHVDYVGLWDDREKGGSYSFSPGINGGYTDLLRGYPDYENLGNLGLDLYMRPPPPLEARWTQHMMFRLSADYFPLQVPNYVYNTTEDLFSLNGTVLWRFTDFAGKETEKWIPFLGLGAGLYWDSTRVNTPASGKVHGTEMYLGANGAAGVFLPCFGNWRLVPEIRYHAIRQLENYWASHISYQIGLVYWLPAVEVE